MPTRLLPAIWEMQGDFAEMQGGATPTLAESCRISIVCMALSLLAGAGRQSFLAGTIQ